jgi:hypothetical protein
MDIIGAQRNSGAARDKSSIGGFRLMPTDYVIDQQRKLVTTTATGVFTAADAFAHQKKLQNDPNFNPHFSQLLDFTSITDVQIDSKSIMQLAQSTVFSAESRRAFVVNSALAFGLARMFGIYREIEKGEEKIRVFKDKDEAMQWLESGANKHE